MVQPDPARLTALGISFGDLQRAIEANNVSRGARYIERNGERHCRARRRPRDQFGGTGRHRGGYARRRAGSHQEIVQVSIGGEPRTGSASENGPEAVVGTALMLIGENSRTVAAAVDARMDGDQEDAAAAELSCGPFSTAPSLLTRRLPRWRRTLREGALLVILVLFLMLGNFRAALITALVIPLSMLMTAIGMWQGKISANLMSLGALDFGLIVDGAVIITENSLRRLGRRQHQLGRILSLEERLATVRAAAEEMVEAERLWPDHHHSCLRARC